jgi:hypothetical protein
MPSTKVQAYTVQSASSTPAPLGIPWRETGLLEVEIEMRYGRGLLLQPASGPE